MMHSTVLITGCSSGVGRETARVFLDDDWVVYATARDPGELTSLERAGATTARLDVTSTDDANRVVEQVVAADGRIDCLINNAGFGQMGPIEDVPVEKVRKQYDVNTFGPHRLMRAVLPHMREQESGTIINVTSITDRFPIAGNGVYSSSKSALATATQTVRQEVRQYGIDVVVVEPMIVSTDFYDRARAELVDTDHGTAYTDLYELLELLHSCKEGAPGIVSPEAVAETMLTAATSDNPKRRYSVGSFAKVGAVGAAVMPESWRTPLLRAGLRTSTTRPAKRALYWWFGRNHQADGDQPG